MPEILRMLNVVEIDAFGRDRDPIEKLYISLYLGFESIRIIFVLLFCDGVLGLYILLNLLRNTMIFILKPKSYYELELLGELVV